MATKSRTAIVGVGYTPVMRQAPSTLGSLAVDAALNAIEDAGLTPDTIDGYVGTPFGPNVSSLDADGIGHVSAGYLAAALGLNRLRFATDIIGLPSTSLVMGMQALLAGLCNYVLLLRAIYNPPARRGPPFGRLGAAGPEQFTQPYGLPGGVGQYALDLQRYMHEYGATREELFAVVKADRAHAQLNPIAYWRGSEVSLEDYLNARWVCEPLCLFDCDLPVTMAGAVIVTTAERARDLPHRPAYISGVAGCAPGDETVFQAAGVEPADVHVAQIYDGYSPFVWYWLEYLGFCATGEAHAFTQGGRIELGGELPINTFGGNLGEGHFQGFGHLREGAMQIMRRCAERQVHDAEHCLVAIGAPNGARSRYAIMLSTD